MDPPTDVHRRVAKDFNEIWIVDPYLPGEIAALPWFRDGISRDDMRVVGELNRLAQLDVHLARKAIDIPQLPGEGAPHIQEVIAHLVRIADNDLGLARRLSEYPWVMDGMSRDEEQSLFDLRFIGEADMDAARQLADYTWMADSLTDGELRALETLRSYAKVDPRYMIKVIDSAWIEDGVTDSEFVNLALSLPQDRKENVTDAVGDTLREYLVHSLAKIGGASGLHLQALGSQDWVSDGLTDEEAAFVTSISRLGFRYPQIYDGLLRERFAQTGTIRLPLSGEVNVWVFSNAPQLEDVDMLPAIEYPVRVAEELLRVPLETKDIVMMIVESDEVTRSFRSATHVQLSVGRGGLSGLSGGSDLLHHEMAHYYFTGTMRWMNEGGAEIIEDLARYSGEIGGSSPGGREAGRLAQDCMASYGFENIRHLHHVRRNNRVEWYSHVLPSRCYYSMGRNFLHVTYDTIGGEALSSALGEIVSSTDTDASDEDKERAIYDAFMKHTPQTRKEAFKDVYRTLHGGPYAFDEIPESEDHGDTPDEATQVEVGEAVRGSLDYMFDFDYFRFQAQEGRKYLFSVAHESLGASSFGLFGPEGERGENENWESRGLGASGPEIVWMAPESGGYYLVVQNFGRKTGTYTLAISEAQDD